MYISNGESGSEGYGIVLKFEGCWFKYQWVFGILEPNLVRVRRLYLTSILN